jgi:hypothetical protein
MTRQGLDCVQPIAVGSRWRRRARERVDSDSQQIITGLFTAPP